MKSNQVNQLLAGMTFLLFLGLKLGNVIDWSWWLVTAPLWSPFAIWLAILMIVAFAVFVRALLKEL